MHFRYRRGHSGTSDDRTVDGHSGGQSGARFSINPWNAPPPLHWWCTRSRYGIDRVALDVGASQNDCPLRSRSRSGSPDQLCRGRSREPMAHAPLPTVLVPNAIPSNLHSKMTCSSVMNTLERAMSTNVISSSRRRCIAVAAASGSPPAVSVLTHTSVINHRVRLFRDYFGPRR